MKNSPSLKESASIQWMPSVPSGSLKSLKDVRGFLATEMEPQLRGKDVLLLPRGAIDRQTVQLEGLVRTVNSPRESLVHIHAKVLLIPTPNASPTFISTMMETREAFLAISDEYLSFFRGADGGYADVRQAQRFIETYIKNPDDALDGLEGRDAIRNLEQLYARSARNNEEVAYRIAREMQDRLRATAALIPWAEADLGIINTNVPHARDLASANRRPSEEGLYFLS